MGNEIEIKGYKINEKFENYGKFLFALSIFSFYPLLFWGRQEKKKLKLRENFAR